MTVTCPLDCEFLLEARKHDRAEPYNPEVLPNADIVLQRKFLNESMGLIAFLGSTLLAEAIEIGAVDFDVREALEALIRTYRTLQSGVFYESVPENQLAAKIFRCVQSGLPEFRQEELKRLGFSKSRDADILALLVYLDRLEHACNNGRRRGRAFLAELKSYYEIRQPAGSKPPSLILP
jgi:hypothetical protein